MAIRDGVDVGVLGVLRGKPLDPGIVKHHALANMVLGLGIGSCVDAGLTDEQILARCKDVLGEIRSAMLQPDPLASVLRPA